jgi:hypothetical protein
MCVQARAQAKAAPCPVALFRLSSSLWFTGSDLDLGETPKAAVAAACGGDPHCVLLADCFSGGKEIKEGLQLAACAADWRER